MFKLLKLAFYGLICYSIYEIYRGMTQPRMAPRGGQRPREDQTIEDFGEPAMGARMTGGGTGDVVQTADDSGTSVSHRVGRGVV